MTLYSSSAQMKVQFYHSEAMAHVNPFPPGGKSREILYLGEEAKSFLESKHPGTRQPGGGADEAYRAYMSTVPNEQVVWHKLKKTLC